ncbi:MAG: biotin/lipoyl-containing protein [Ignavibacteriaceae bacterium]
MESNKESVKIVIDDMSYETKLTNKFLKRKIYAKPDVRKLNAFIPGVVLDIKIKKGQKVSKGEHLMVLEAMKMKNSLIAPIDGKVKEIYVKEGEMVTKNQLILEFE